MTKIKNFYDLTVWKEAFILVQIVYEITAKFPKEEICNLISQARRAVVSITNNLAEGFCRFHFRDKINFYYDSRGSLGETQNCMIIAKKLGLIKEKNDFVKFWRQAEKVNALINGLINSTGKQMDRDK